MESINKKTWLVIIVAVAILICAFAVWKLHTLPGVSTPNSLNITTTAGNYGLFIDNQDNEYFSTHDANVRNIIEKYIVPQYIGAKTDAEKYGQSLIYYYTKDNFIAANLYNWADQSNINAFTMYDMKTGKPISECNILARAGMYKDSDILLSASYIDNGTSMKLGACLYERGAPNFKFIDLTPQLSSTETLFADPAGQDLRAMITHIDKEKRTFLVDVYDNTIKDASGAVVPGYKYKRSIEVSY